MDSMTSSCCLCYKSLPEDHRKRKKLHGKSCNSAREVLQRLCPVPLHTIPEISLSCAVICQHCEKMLKDISSLEVKLENLRSDATLMLSKLIQKHSTGPSLLGKHGRSAEDHQEPLSLRYCLEPRSLPISLISSQASYAQSELQQQVASTSSQPCPSHCDTISTLAKLPSSQAAQLPHTETRLSSSQLSLSQTAPQSLSSLAQSSSSLTDQTSPTCSQATSSSQTKSKEISTGSVQVTVSYQKGDRRYNVKTPSRQNAIKHLSRKSYRSLATDILNSPLKRKNLLTQVALRIKKEMKDLASDEYDTILKDTVEAVKMFSWETVKLELIRKMPTLMSLLSQLVPKPEEHTALICMIASQLLKCRHRQLCLVQRAVSIMFYGNGTAKQVYCNIQPLNICLSLTGTMNIVKKISEGYNMAVLEWQDDLTKRIIKPQHNDVSSAVSAYSSLSLAQMTEEWSSSPSASSQPDTPPPFSPLSLFDSDIDHDQHNSQDSNSDGMSEQAELDEPQDSQHSQTRATHSSWNGYKFVGDNIDKSVKATFQRAEHRGHSLHYFHGYAVKDRADFSMLSDEKPPRQNPNPEELLPSTNDVLAYKKELETLVARILVQHLDQFASQKKIVDHHIPSRYSTEMASKSETVPLGVLLLDENKLEEMSQILMRYMELVPTLASEGHFTLPNKSVITFDDTRFWQVLFGGDQLTVARIRGTQALRDTQDSPQDRLEGVTPVVEDWHTRMTLLKLIWTRLFSQKSTREIGTMYHLRNLICRTVVPKDPEKNVSAAEDFMLLMVHTHVVAVARQIMLKTPTFCVKALAKIIVDKFVNLPNVSQNALPSSDDTIHLYAIELLSLGLLWHGFHDAVREADGDRILRYWKFLLVLFKSSSHRNYAKEAVNVLFQYNYVFSDRQKAQLLWSRCVNTRGNKGTNIPCDLHMEHLNRRLKTIIRSMGSNVTPSRIQRAGESLAPVHRVCEAFEKQTANQVHTDKHPYPSFGKDFLKVIASLQEGKVFDNIPGRNHPSFKFNKSIFSIHTKAELIKKVKSSMEQLV